MEPPSPAPTRRRSPNGNRRSHAVTARFADDEFELVSAAAAHALQTTTGFVAQNAVAIARGLIRPLPTTTAEVVRELVEARTQLRRYGTLLNQAVAKLNATGEVTAGLQSSVDRCEVAVAAIRDASSRLARDR